MKNKYKCRQTKHGQYSYYFEVSHGSDATGKRVRHHKTWTSPLGMTKRQADKQADIEYGEFLKEIEYNQFAPSRDVTFAEYAKTAMALKQRKKIKPKTVVRYNDILEHVNQYIGHKKLTDLTAADLDLLYELLSKEGARRESPKATAKVELLPLLKSQKISISKLAAKAGLSASTVGIAVKGTSVTLKTAEKISSALGKDVALLFDSSKNTAGLSSKTIREYHNLISSILEIARKKHLVPTNVAADATPPSFWKPKPEYLQPNEVKALCNALLNEPLQWQLLIFLFLATGARRGEVVGLKWSDYDQENNMLHIHHALVYTPETGVIEGPTKEDDERFLLLPSLVDERLLEHRAQQAELFAANGKTLLDSDYIFTNAKGEHLHPDSINGWLNRFCARREFPHLHPHEFRHTAASILIGRGTDIVTVARIMGHASPNITLEFYAHLIAKQLAGAAACLDDAIFGKLS